MGKSYREQIVLPASAMAVAWRAQQVLTDAPRVYWVKVQPHESHPDFVQAWVDVSMRSWGEMIMVYLSEVSGETVAEIESRCKFPWQVIDWGKNKSNVLHIIKELRTWPLPQAS